MSNKQHTPAPWAAREVNGAGYPGQRGFAIDFNEDQEQVVDFVYEEADAYLIAAAPELLEALEEALAEIKTMKAEIGFRCITLDVMRKCSDVIARAKGEQA